MLTYWSSQDDEGLLAIAAVGAKLEDLVEGHVRQPHVVLLVHRQHVRQVEEAGAPPLRN